MTYSSTLSQHPSDATPNAFFNQQWQTYRRVLAHNYMHHREMAQRTREYLAGRFNQCFRMLDLGCGDGFFTRQALPAGYVSEYTGVDLSAAALQLAAAELQGCADSLSFRQADLAAAADQLAAECQRFDVVLASFSVHHLQLEQKRRLFRSVRQLVPDGVFVMIDCVRKPAETRDDYLKRYLGWVEANWTELSAEEIAAIREHITTCDFPESYAILEQLAGEQGFKADCLNLPAEHIEVLAAFADAP